MLSFSTCWNSGRHTRGEDMLAEIVDLGFRNVELGHGIRVSLLEGIQRFRERGNVNLTSLHNFCPLPVEVMAASPNCYEFTSHRPADRKRAVKLTLQTIDWADRLGAPLVVLHLGRIPGRAYTRELIEMTADGKRFSRAYVRKKLAAVRQRERQSAAAMLRVRESLLPVIEHAASKNIHLGIEGRESYEEIPSERELPPLLDELASPYAGYWHDIGHIQIKENLGLVDHGEWLARIRSRTFGCHLHDVAWPDQDHRAPFTGSIDYDKLVPLLPESCLFVWEIGPRRSREEITTARARWIQRFGE
jgi:sugar phosphate isomerase/epimerase